VYGETLRIPSELLTLTTEPVEPAHLITQLRDHMVRVRPIPAAHHASSATFVHKDLHSLSPSGRNTLGSGAPLQRALPGPLAERENNAAPCVSADSVKPAYVLNEADCGSTIFNPLGNAAPDIAPPAATQTTRFGRRVRYRACFNT
jgi:hypothetical protein